MLARIAGDLYAALWKNITGRPWTYVMRQWVMEHPRQAKIVVPAGLIVVAGLQVFSVLFKVWLVLAITDFLVLLTGHLFWDTAGAYIKPRRYRRKGTGLWAAESSPPRTTGTYLNENGATSVSDV